MKYCCHIGLSRPNCSSIACCWSAFRFSLMKAASGVPGISRNMKNRIVVTASSASALCAKRSRISSWHVMPLPSLGEVAASTLTDGPCALHAPPSRITAHLPRDAGGTHDDCTVIIRSSAFPACRPGSRACRRPAGSRRPAASSSTSARPVFRLCRPSGRASRRAPARRGCWPGWRSPATRPTPSGGGRWRATGRAGRLTSSNGGRRLLKATYSKPMSISLRITMSGLSLANFTSTSAIAAEHAEEVELAALQHAERRLGVGHDAHDPALDLGRLEVVAEVLEQDLLVGRPAHELERAGADAADAP